MWVSLSWGFKNVSANAEDVGSIPGLGRSPGEGNVNPLQHSCLENSTDRRAWWATRTHKSLMSPWSHKRVRHDLATKATSLPQDSLKNWIFQPFITGIIKGFTWLLENKMPTTTRKYVIGITLKYVTHSTRWFPSLWIQLVCEGEKANTLWEEGYGLKTCTIDISWELFSN